MPTHHTIFKTFAQADRGVPRMHGAFLAVWRKNRYYAAIAHLKVAATVCNE